MTEKTRQGCDAKRGSPLRRRMMDQMRIANLAENTCKAYILEIERLARHYEASPAEQVRAWLLTQIDRGLSPQPDHLKPLPCLSRPTPNPVTRSSTVLPVATGLAAVLCENPSDELRSEAKRLGLKVQWGARDALLYELGAFVGRTLTNPPEPHSFREAAEALLRDAEVEDGWIYGAVYPDGCEGTMFSCPACDYEAPLDDVERLTASTRGITSSAKSGYGARGVLSAFMDRPAKGSGPAELLRTISPCWSVPKASQSPTRSPL